MPNKKLFCFDFGGSKCGLGVMVDEKLFTGGDDYKIFNPANLDGLKFVISKAIHEKGKPDGLAIATAGVIIDHKTIQVSPNIHWLDGINLAKWARDNWDLPCVVSNDMEAAVAGEMAFGNLKGIKNALMFTVSTGFGGAVVVDGKRIVSEPGHTKSPILVNGLSKICKCGKIDCVEAHLSGGGVRKLLRSVFMGQEDLFEGGDPCAYLDKEAAKEVPWATDLYNQIGTGIGEFWATALNLLSSTERIIYNGTFSIRAMPFMIEAIKKAMRKRLMFEHHKKVVSFPINDDTGGLIFETALEGENALYGAAAVYEEVLGEHHTI